MGNIMPTKTDKNQEFIATLENELMKGFGIPKEFLEISNADNFAKTIVEMFNRKSVAITKIPISKSGK